MNLSSHLISLGLTEKEAKLYLTLLEVGPNPVSSIARKAGITRTTAYAALETLKEKGLVSTIEERGIQQFAPVSPHKLEEYAKHHKEQAERNYEELKTVMPMLKSLTGDLVMKPRVQYFEGVEGIKTIYKDTIDVLKEFPKRKRIKYAYSSAPRVESELRSFLDDYIKLRKKEGVKMQGILPDSKRSWEFHENAQKNNAEVRIMPRDLSIEFDFEINIYGDKLSIMSLKKDRLHGIIIESPEIVATQKVLFDIIWRASKKSDGL